MEALTSPASLTLSVHAWASASLTLLYSVEAYPNLLLASSNWLLYPSTSGLSFLASCAILTTMPKKHVHCKKVERGQPKKNKKGKRWNQIREIIRLSNRPRRRGSRLWNYLIQPLSLCLLQNNKVKGRDEDL